MLKELTHIFHIASMAVLSALVLEVGVNNVCLLSAINVPNAAHESHTVLEEFTHIFHIGSMAILSALFLEVGVNNACLFSTIYDPHDADKSQCVGRADTYISYLLDGDSVCSCSRCRCK